MRLPTSVIARKFDTTTPRELHLTAKGYFILALFLAWTICACALLAHPTRMQVSMWGVAVFFLATSPFFIGAIITVGREHRLLSTGKAVSAKILAEQMLVHQRTKFVVEFKDSNGTSHTAEAICEPGTTAEVRKDPVVVFDSENPKVNLLYPPDFLGLA